VGLGNAWLGRARGVDCRELFLSVVVDGPTRLPRLLKGVVGEGVDDWIARKMKLGTTDRDLVARALLRFLNDEIGRTTLVGPRPVVVDSLERPL